MHLRPCSAWLLPVLLLLSGFTLSAADETLRPVCKPDTQGQMWPDIANHDRSMISQLARCGDLLICVRGTWHYHWESASVTVNQLDKKQKRKNTKLPACEIEPVASNTKTSEGN
jgi:hypothetical protein